jgi:hypothetical protein
MAPKATTPNAIRDLSEAVSRQGIGRGLMAFYMGLVAIQAVHVAEHMIQLGQVYGLGLPEDEALGLLGYIFEFQGTEEWLHLGFNSAYLAGLVVVLVGLLRSPLAREVVPLPALVAFAVFGVWLEGWHVVEHVVIIGNVLANDGCPCPGIVDAQIGIADTVLHFGYNVAAFLATAAPLLFLLGAPLRLEPDTPRGDDPVPAAPTTVAD